MIQIVGQNDKYIHILGFLINLSDRQEARGGLSPEDGTPVLRPHPSHAHKEGSGEDVYWAEFIHNIIALSQGLSSSILDL